uniref:Ceramide kinase-like n=1 Tax=Phallusia mammillata TaxID=59560 RepID=A0A6F9D679_9ASCI|nr:ceramide kinase-like [Phallusia mammillata]
MNVEGDAKHPDSSLQFLTNKAVVTLQVKENFLHVRCLKKLNPFDPRPFSSFHCNIYLCDILSTATSESEWKVHSKVESLNTANIGSLLHSTASQCKLLLVHIAVKSKGSLWKLQTLKFRCKNTRQCSAWSTYLNENITTSLGRRSVSRPKSLLVFVNPYGGKHKAVDIHKHIVTPIFNKAGIRQLVVVTEYQNHAKEYLKTADLGKIDGIIAVGGDGMANEIINGVLIQVQEKNNISLDKPPADLSEACPSFVRPSIRIGVIPAGSTNCLSYVSQGFDDPETAALHIALGAEHNLDLSSIHDRNGAFQRFSFSMTSFGFYGNVLKLSERMRGLGPSRYDVAGIHSFLHQCSYNMKVWYLPSDTPVDIANDRTKCRYPCNTCCLDKLSDFEQTMSNGDVCSKPSPILSGPINTNFFNNAVHYEVNSNSEDGSQITLGAKITSQTECFESTKSCDNANGNNKWQVTEGKFLMINSALMSCACSRCPQGLSPSAHLADGNTDLILVRNCSRADFVRYMFSHVGKANRFRFPFVEVYRVKGFRCEMPIASSSVTCEQIDIKQTESECSRTSSCWNTDGELVPDPNIHVWVHKGLIKLFAKGIDQK